MNPYREALQKLLAAVDAEAIPALESHYSLHPKLRASAEFARSLLEQAEPSGPALGWYDPATEQVLSATQMYSLQNHQGLPGRRLALQYSVALTACDPALAADAARWRLMWRDGLPVTFRGVEHFSKRDCDVAMDAVLAGGAEAVTT